MPDTFFTSHSRRITNKYKCVGIFIPHTRILKYKYKIQTKKKKEGYAFFPFLLSFLPLNTVKVRLRSPAVCVCTV